MKKHLIVFNVIVFLVLLGINVNVSGQSKTPDWKTTYHISIPDGCQDPAGYQVIITHHYSNGTTKHFPATFQSGSRNVEIEVSYNLYGIRASISTNIPGVSFPGFDRSIPPYNTWTHRYVVGICAIEPPPGVE